MEGASGALLARNAAHGLTLRFDATSVDVEHSGWSARFRTTGLRCAEKRLDVKDGAFAAMDSASNRAVAVRRAGRARFDEWYENGPRGVEQGFDFETNPCDGSGELAIEVNATGLTPRSSLDGVALVDGAGDVRARLVEPSAIDSLGRTLPIRLAANDGERIEILVETANAAWPVRVDPLLATQEAKFRQQDSATYRFGEAIAVSGNTLVVGAKQTSVEGRSAGAAFVFERSGASWSGDRMLFPPDAGFSDQIGASVAIDGDTVLVGANAATVGSNAGQGAVYVYVRSGAGWVLQQKLTVSDGAANDLFGSAVAVAGNLAVVGAPYANKVGKNGTGVAYFFSRSGTKWTQQQRILASDAVAFAAFGTTVALGSNTLLVGAPGTGAGSAYSFALSANTWTQQQKIVPSDGAEFDGFGRELSMSGALAIVGSSGASGALKGQGKAYVYARSGSTWLQQQILTADAPSTSGAFGTKVAIDGGLAVVSTNSSSQAWLFGQSGGSWSLLTHLTSGVSVFGKALAVSAGTVYAGGDATPGDHVSNSAVYAFTGSAASWTLAQAIRDEFPAGSGFAASGSVSGNIAVVGAPYSRGQVNGQGATYVYSRTGTAWSSGTRLFAADGAEGDAFGTSVAVSGTQLLVGAPFAAERKGVAYVFTSSASGWSQSALLQPADGLQLDEFGTIAALDGSRAVITTAFTADDGGDAYVFDRGSSGAWQQTGKLHGSDIKGALDRYATAIAVSDKTVFVGAFNQGATTRRSGNAIIVVPGYGAVYAFTQTGNTWTEQKLVASDISQSSGFGYDLAVDGDTALVAAPSAGATGTVYVFTRGASGWTETQKLTSAQAVAGGAFGSSVALVGDTALIGARMDKVGSATSQGALYVFIRSGSTWTEQPRLIANDGAANDQFGTAISLSGSLALVTAPGVAASTATYPGAAYVMRLPYLVGSACVADGDCASPYHCVDSVCCSTACSGRCEVCAASRGATRDGICTPRPAGSPGSPVCTNNVLCDGVGGECLAGCKTDDNCTAGFYCANGSCAPSHQLGDPCSAANCVDPDHCHSCASGYCVDGVCCENACDQPCAQCRGGSGVCTFARAGSAGTPDCGAYVCSGSNLDCPTSCSADTDCTSGVVCVDGACVGSRELGDTCSKDVECQSKHCADGKCCNTACNGQCEWCGGTSEPGICKPTSGEPKGSRESCAGTGTCAGRCDGAKRDGCVYAGSAIECAPAGCADDATREASTCDGAGECSAGALHDCGNFTCDDAVGACKTSCTTRSDCRRGAVCDTSSGTGTCNPSGATCVGGDRVRDSEGVETSCNGYLCVGGACQQQCDKNTDCAAGFECDRHACIAAPRAEPDGGSGTPPRGIASDAGAPGATPDGSSTPEHATGTSKENSGCGCRLTPSPRSTTPSILLGAAIVALLGWRRRRLRKELNPEL